MTHPTREDWMSYLYDEVTPGDRATMSAHLDACDSCRRQIETWQRARAGLDAFTVAAKPKSFANPAVVRWAAAAALVGLLTFGILHVAALHREVRQLRADLQGSFRREVENSVRLEVARQARADVDRALAEWSSRREQADANAEQLMAALSRKIESQRAADQQATFTALQALSARQTRDIAALRSELETVAILTEAGLQSAQTQIATLADSPGSNSRN